MATVAEVESVLDDLVARLDRSNPAGRAALPGRRTVELDCTDLDRTYTAVVEGGGVTLLESGAGARPDVRITCHSDDLVAVGRGSSSFARAYTAGRIRLEASTADLLLLRAML